MLRNIIVTLIY